MSHYMKRLLNMNTFLIGGLLLSFVSGISAQQKSPASPKTHAHYAADMENADRQIFAAERQHSDAMANEEYLTTFIGPRLTGSPEMIQASQWTLKMFQKYGLDTHLETTQIAHSWTRGNDWGELMAPVQHWMQVHSAAWGKATPGPVTGRLVAIDRTLKPEEIFTHLEKYKGAIVLFDEPAGRSTLPVHPANSYDAVVTAYYAALLKLPMKTLLQMFGNQEKVIAALGQAGAIATLRDSQEPYALLHMGGAGGSAYHSSALPTAYISHPDYEWLLRLAKAGQGMFQIDLNGIFSPGPASASNVVAQIRGSEFPDQQVVIGGHLDSWDLAEGATDNGTGAMAVLEAARLLKSLGWTPKRTLTFILFFGEEQGVQGSRAFVKAHASELDKVDAVLVDDVGAGRITSIPLENLWPAAPLLSKVYAPLQKTFDLEPMSNQYFSSSDHVPFLWSGVPAFLAVQAPADYGYAHHTNFDVFELVQPDALKQQAAVLAAWMWNVSQLPEPLPHHPKQAGIE